MIDFHLTTRGLQKKGGAIPRQRNASTVAQPSMMGWSTIAKSHGPDADARAVSSYDDRTSGEVLKPVYELRVTAS